SHPIAAMGGNGFYVGCDPCTRGRIETGDRQDRRRVLQHKTESIENSSSWKLAFGTREVMALSDASGRSARSFANTSAGPEWGRSETPGAARENPVWLTVNAGNSFSCLEIGVKHASC